MGYHYLRFLDNSGPYGSVLVFRSRGLMVSEMVVVFGSV